MRTFLVLTALVAAAGAQPVYWWRYNNTDAENLDIRQLPCAWSCTLEELEAACVAEPTCVAFNTHGWLKNSVADMSADSCDLYIKHSTPQPTPVPPQPIAFWPLPVHIQFGSKPLSVDPTLAFTVNPPSSAVSAYASRLAALVFQHSAGGPAPFGALASVSINVADVNAPLELGVDESYSIEIDGTTTCQLNANTIYGAFMGLQTLSQAIRFDFDSQEYSIAATPLVIQDAPKFAWRGILVDTDRHWLSLPHLYRIIDSLGYAKMNIMHWHIVDWQSWPLQSTAYPNLWSAAWSNRERYTLNDVVAVIKYANDRGIRVVPEFDTPGHATSMCTGYPELCVPISSCGPGNNAPLTPCPDANGTNVALEAIQAVLSELAALSPDQFFHLGGDEVDQTCWNTSSVLAWMANQHPPMTSTDQVYEYFVSTVDEMAINLKKSPIRWEEVWAHFGTQLDMQTVIHAWLSREAVINATNLGYRAIWSVDGQYYLDALLEPWEQFYNVDILEGVTNSSAIPLILGGEVEMWAETADGSDVLQTIWPRAAAAAERQWSYDAVTNSSDPNVAPRLQAFRCLLLERGIPAAPVTNSIARQAPSGPGSCLAQ